MKKIKLLIVSCLFVSSLGFTKNVELNWLTDFNKAVDTAKKENKMILADFSGSDWCKWCIKLDKEIIDTVDFKEFADKNLVPFLADFPMKKKQSKELKDQNDSLMKKYGVEGFPTILLIDPKTEKVFYQTGYARLSPKEYSENLSKEIEKYKNKETK